VESCNKMFFLATVSCVIPFQYSGLNFMEKNLDLV